MKARIHILLFIGLLSVVKGTAAEQSPPKNVLVLYSERGDLPAIQVTEQNIREVFQGSEAPRIDLFSEYFDFSRFPPSQSSEAIETYLQQRYSGKKLDMVITVGGLALEFALTYREKLFPRVPLVFCASERREIDRLFIPPDVSGVVGHFDFERTIQLILRLQPNVTEINCVAGTSAFDMRWAAEGAKELQRFPNLKVRWISNATLAATVAEVAELPSNQAVLFFSYLRDGAGRSFTTPDVLKELVPISRAPVYALASHLLPTGIAGGAMFDFGTNGRRTASLALKILRGEGSFLQDEGKNPIILNWPALKRWGLNEALVPSDAIVVGHSPGLWETHGSLIVAGLTLGTLQSLLLVALIIQRVGKRRVEASLRESDKRMNLAAEAANLGLWVWNMDRDEIWMSEKCRDLFSVGRSEELNSERFLQLLSTEEQPRARQAIEHSISTGDDLDIEIGVRTPEGVPRWVSSRGRLDYGAKRLLGVSVDITTQRAAMLDAEVHREELAHLSRVALMGEMASSLAHELNQPLTGIMANAHAGQRYLQKDSLDKKEMQELFNDIADDSQRADSVIRSIRDMVKKGKFQPQDLDINSVITQVAKIMRAHTISRNCELILELAKGLPKIRGNAPQLQQVFINLLLNAFDAMQETVHENRKVILTTECSDDMSVSVCVRDFGCGLPEGGRRIFEKFFTTKRDGLGMGLVIAGSIVEAHGGRLTASNAADVGAVVCVLLPGIPS